MRVISVWMLSVMMAAASTAGVDERLPVFDVHHPTPRESTLHIVGSDVMADLLEAWAERFSGHYPQVTVELSLKDSRTGPPALTSGKAQIIAMTRPMTESELAAFIEKFGYAPTAMAVAGEMIGIYVHKDNPVADKGLTLAQVDAIFGSERRLGHDKDIKTWGDAGLVDGPWKERAITPYGRNSASATYGVFKQLALAKGPYKDTVREQPGGPVIAAVAHDTAGITYSGIGYLREGIRAVPLAKDADSKPVPLEAKRFAEYPLSRSFYLYVNHKPDGWLPREVAEFLRLVFSREGQAVVERNGYVPLGFDTARRELGKVRVGLYAVDGKLPGYRSGVALTGSIRSLGSDTMNNLMTLWAEQFLGHHPDVRVEIEGKGGSTPPPALIAGTIDFGAMTRPMLERELAPFREKFGYDPTALRVAIDQLAIYVHKDNPVAKAGLTLAQVDAIFSATRLRGHERDITTWRDLGLEGEWAGKPISLYGRNSAAGTYGYFKQRALKGGDFKASVQEQPGSSSVVAKVAVDRFGIGYTGVGYRTDDVAVVPLADEGDKFITPVAEHAETYPLSRYLLLYVNCPPGRTLPPVQAEFVKLIFSRPGQRLVAMDGFLPVDADHAKAELSKAGIGVVPALN